MQVYSENLKTGGWQDQRLVDNSYLEADNSRGCS